MKLPEQDITPARCASLYETGAHLRARARAHSLTDQSCKAPNVAQCQCFVYRRQRRRKFVKSYHRRRRGARARTLIPTREARFLFVTNATLPGVPHCLLYLALSLSLAFSLAASIPRDIPAGKFLRAAHFPAGFRAVIDTKSQTRKRRK